MRYRADYSVYSRTLPSGRVVWYYRCYADGRRQAGRSLGIDGAGKRALAVRQANALLKAGKLAGPVEREPTLSEWSKARHWWVWNGGGHGRGKTDPACLYLRAQLARSDPDRPAVSRGYADRAHQTLQDHILPAHGTRRLSAITSADLEALLFAWLDAGLSRKTVNNRASIYRIMLREAHRLGAIRSNPWAQVRGMVAGTTERGQLTPEEALRLMDPATLDAVWGDGKPGSGHHLYWTANLVAMFTGRRQGEILALRGADVHADHLRIAASWDIEYGRGPTKDKRAYDVPIPAFVRRELARYADAAGPQDYVLSYHGGRPCTGNRVTEWLYRAMERVGIPGAERKRRGIVFHSWRRFHNTWLRGRGYVPDALVRRVIGHATAAMTEHYTGFQAGDYAPVVRAQEELAGRMGGPPPADTGA